MKAKTQTTKKQKITTHGSTSGDELDIDVPNIKEWKPKQSITFYSKEGKAFMDSDGEVVVRNMKVHVEDDNLIVEGRPSEEINYWKYACLTILFGAVSGMIISTPFIINAVEVCSQ